MKTIEKVEFGIFIVVFFAIIGALIITAVNEASVNIAQVLLMFALVLITYIYARRTAEIAKATKEQAEASIKMAEEMKEQRIMASRPIIIQKAMYKEDIYEGSTSREFEYFAVYNAGNGTAIEVEISLCLQRKKPYQTCNGQREGFLRAGDKPIKFHPTIPPAIGNSTFYIVSEYQGTSTDGTNTIWYQTWLPCELSISGKVICGKLEFDEVSEEKRIGLFADNF